MAIRGQYEKVNGVKGSRRSKCEGLFRIGLNAPGFGPVGSNKSSALIQKPADGGAGDVDGDMV